MSKYNNDIIIGEAFEPITVAETLIHSYVEVDNLDFIKGITGSKTRLEDRFTVDELEAIAKHILVYVEMKRKEEMKDNDSKRD